MLIKLLAESNAFERQRRDTLPSIKTSLSECLDIIDLGVDSSLLFFCVKLLRQSNIFYHLNILAKSLQMEQKTRQIQQIRVREEGVSERRKRPHHKGRVHAIGYGTSATDTWDF